MSQNPANKSISRSPTGMDGIWSFSSDSALNKTSATTPVVQSPYLIKRARSLDKDLGLIKKSTVFCCVGHKLKLCRVDSAERDTLCGCCHARIKIKPIHVVHYRCNECSVDACPDCLDDDMLDALIVARADATVRHKIQHTTIYLHLI